VESNLFTLSEHQSFAWDIASQNQKMTKYPGNFGGNAPLGHPGSQVLVASACVHLDYNISEKIGKASPAGYTCGKAAQRSSKGQVV